MKRFCATFLMLAALLAVSSSAYSDERSDRRLRFEATLSGAQEVTTPPGGVDTDTTGEIQVRFDAGLTQAEFELSVFNGEGVTVAHFHCERPGRNGPVVIFLFGPVDPIDVDGELAEGTLTNAGFLPAGAGPGATDCPALIGRPVNNIASLAFAMRDGLIYANVHTVAHSGGEVRGQLLEKILEKK
jgi:CHRD domain